MCVCVCMCVWLRNISEKKQPSYKNILLETTSSDIHG